MRNTSNETQRILVKFVFLSVVASAISAAWLQVDPNDVGPVPIATKNQVSDIAVTVPRYPDAVQLVTRSANGRLQSIDVQQCQFSIYEPRTIMGVDCGTYVPPHQEAQWQNSQPIPFESYGPGEYVGPARLAHVAEYRLRVDDLLDFVYRFTHEESKQAYRLGVGDEIVVESYPDKEVLRGDINQGRGLEIQPDGTIVLPYIGRISVSGRTTDEVTKLLEEKYSSLYNNISFTVTPLKTNVKLEGLRSTVDARFGNGGQTRQATISPDGTVQLVGIDSVPAQGLSMGELQSEINARYRQLIGPGVEVTVVLRQRAPRIVWVMGEVRQPGQFLMPQPITAMQAIALAQGSIAGANLREIVVFRRDDRWRLLATRLDLAGALFGKSPSPSDNIWLRDNDIVIVPKGPIQRIDDFVNLVFTRGIYGVVPFQGMNINFSKNSTI